MKIAIIGAAGMVGNKILQVIDEQNIDAQFFLFGEQSQENTIVFFNGENYKMIALSHKSLLDIKPDFVLFVAGGTVSAEYAPVVASYGGIAIDNSSHFRMHNNIPLVIPEVNPELIKNIKDGAIIANPNCSTIQSVVALAPLHDRYILKRIIYTTYQATSGAGLNGVLDLERGIRGEKHQTFQYQIFDNIIPQIDEFQSNGTTREEQKMIDETRKILGMPNLHISATCVRVPIKNSHSVSIVAEFENKIDITEVRTILESAPGINVMDKPAAREYPMPIHANEQDEVFVGRLRVDESASNILSMLVVADNVRKGAATNAVQILKILTKRHK
ncbi:MAG: aspartate-semialdehyde dehydrogenase [Firmicutes bacterium]|nr:aspartate-semialdehyde dehydrogenase [Bacillota bacterium]